MSHSLFDDDAGVNPSCEPTIAEIIEARVTRRAVLKGMAAASVLGLFGCAAPTRQGVSGGSTLTFTEIGRVLDETHHVAPGYNVQVLIRWGDPVFKGAPSFKPGAQTAQEQELQFGSDNDFIAFLPLPKGSRDSDHGLLCVNHESVTRPLAWPGVTNRRNPVDQTLSQSEVEMAAQGHSIIEIRRLGSRWETISDGRFQRRISLRTPMKVSGPARGNSRMHTGADPAGQTILGTLGNCAGGTTPWGTVLTAEENFFGYFIGDAAKGPETSARKRYRIDGRGRYYHWGKFIDRFNLDREPNEPNRFGWIVEIDPYDPQSTPVKRTALGRFFHEGSTPAVSHDGRVAVYSGDDDRNEYVYKFVTRQPWDPQRPQGNRDLLDEGILHVARFGADGRMHWLPLVFGTGPLTEANGFRNQADVVIEARHAADLVGATPMDRPEDVEANPFTGNIYVALTFNEARKPDQVDAANPRGPNNFGHIIEIVPPLVNGKPDHTATECAWNFFLIAGDPANSAHGARYSGPVSSNGWLACPDNLAFDPRGRIWIATDGQEYIAKFADSLYAAETGGAHRGVTRCFFNGPRGSEITGPEFTPDGRTLFLSIQHPGDEEGSTFDNPSTRWPDFKEGMPPRSSVVAITKGNGGEIGS